MDKSFWRKLSTKQLKKERDTYAAIAQGRDPMPGHLTTGRCWEEHRKIEQILQERAREEAEAVQ